MWSQTRFFFVLLALTFWCEQVHALRVLVVQPPARDAALFEAFGRLRAELELQGFEVLLMNASASPISTDALEVEAKGKDAFAAIALQREPAGTTASIQVVDRMTGKVVTRKLKISDGEDGPMLLAVRASDLLRASLLELEPGQQAPEDVVGASHAPAPQAVEQFSRERAHFQVWAGGLVLWHPDLGASWGGSLAVSYRPHERISLGVEFGGPALGGDFEVGEDSASVREEFLLARFSYNLGETDWGGRWEWGPSLRVGATHVTATGNVAPPLSGSKAQVWAFSVGAGGYVERFFSDTVSLGLHVLALGLVPQPVIAIAGERSVPIRIQGAMTLGLGISF